MRLLMFLLLACRAPADPSLPPGYRVAQAEVREGPFTNRLALATSPYLVQHAHDPVDWRPWGPEALAVAAERDVPVFLSIGYAACHWCHVMQHESFQDPDVAAFLNERFVPVKLDREERPDVDAVYMDAVYALNRGRGGWPASLWLTPQGEPFFAGTYYPPTAGRGRPGFRDVLEALDTAWRTDRASVIHDASRLAEALRAASVVDRGDTPGAEAAVAALRALVTSWDDETQGWGTRKFPMAPRLEALLAYGITTEDPASLRVVRQTLHAMDRGGIHDQIGGGFHRYTVDPRWRIPHFEKMLYDNGQLLGVYAAAAVALDEPRFAEVADGIATWMLRELVDPRTGAFASSQDADTEGVEGLTYTWTPEELRAVLGDDAGPVMAAYGVTEAGTFDEGRSVLIRVGEVPDDRVRARLLEARRRRPQPRTDTKLVVSYNALAIGGLARAGRLLERPGWVTAARAAADAILAARDPSGRLPRTLAPDAPAGVLDDYAMLADALVELHEADGDPRWLREADAVVAAMDRILWNDASGTWNHSAATDLIVTRTELTDGPEPAGAAVAARIHARLSALGAPAARPDRVEATLGAGAAHFGVATPTLAWTRLLIDRPAMSLVVAVDDPADAAPFRALWSSTWRPRGVFAVVGPDGVDGFATLADKSPGEAGPRAFLCEGGVCQAPADDVATVADQLATLHDAAIGGAEAR